MRQIDWVVVVAGLGVAAAGAGAQPAWTPEPHVRIAPIVTLDSLWLPNPGAWSPRGVCLALRRGPNQLWVFDASRPKTPPRMLYDARQWIRSATWSPDGEWLLLLIGDANAFDLRTLVAVPLTAGGPDTLRAGETMLRAVWGPDGLVYFRTPHEWLELPPPSRWKPTTAFHVQPAKAIDTGEGLAVTLGPPDPRQPYELVCFGTFRQDTRMVSILEALPDLSRLLVRISEDTTGVTELVDGHGQALTRLGAAFEPTALSSDGRLIVGSDTDLDPKHGGYNHSWLVAADAAGHWTTMIAGGDGGSAPQMSREGSVIAYTARRGTRVARLTVEGPARE